MTLVTIFCIDVPARTTKTDCIKFGCESIPRRKSMMLICSRMRQLYMFHGPSVLLLTFRFLGFELELQFLNHISLFTKLLNSLAFCYINDHDLFMLFVFQCVFSRKKNITDRCCFFRSPKVHI